MNTTTALLLIDVQANMFDPASPVTDAVALEARLRSLLARARAARALVVFVRNCGGPGDPDLPGTAGWELLAGFEPDENELVLDKTTCNTFTSTDLAEQLESRGVRHLVVAGLQSDYCVRETTLGAVGLGYRVTLVSDGHSTYDSKTQKAAEISAAVNAELAPRVKLRKAGEVDFQT